MRLGENFSHIGLGIDQCVQRDDADGPNGKLSLSFSHVPLATPTDRTR